MGLLDKIKGMVNTDDEYGDNYGLDETENDDIIPTRSATSRPGMNISGHDNSVAIELKVVRPESYSSVTEIADHLLNHRTVVLNLEATNREVAKRLIDFLAGVAYSIDGQLKNVANNTYIITPCNVDVADSQIRAAEPRRQASMQQPTPVVNLTSDTLF